MKNETQKGLSRLVDHYRPRSLSKLATGDAAIALHSQVVAFKLFAMREIDREIAGSQDTKLTRWTMNSRWANVTWSAHLHL